MDLKDKGHCTETISRIRKIWEKRHCVIVEGEGTRMGVGNDLFDNAFIDGRLLCPSVDAFKKYDRILDYIRSNISKEALILIALGMTATVLAYDLALIGYQAIDIGHIDIEYEWYLMKAETKCAITNKSVNEIGQNILPGLPDKLYQNQILAHIA